MRVYLITLVSIVLSACGMSESEKNRTAKFACAELGATTEEQDLEKIKIVNLARQEIGEEPFLGSTDEIERYRRWGTCELFVKNDMSFREETDRRQQVFATVRGSMPSTSGITEIFTDGGQYLLLFFANDEELQLLDSETLTPFLNGIISGATIEIVEIDEDLSETRGRVEGKFVNGSPDGLTRGWHENGQLYYESNYVEGKQEGVDRGWYENGQLYYESNYVEGKQEGVDRGWYENGQLRYEENYVEGKTVGVQRQWKTVESNIVGGKLEGIHRSWTDDGNRLAESNWVNGKREGLGLYFKIDGSVNELLSSCYSDGQEIELSMCPEWQARQEN